MSELIKEIIELQNRASNPADSVYVAASAGSGKTKILVDRYIRLMLAGVDPKAILAITFTKAAAREMRERISSKLYVWHTSLDHILLNELEIINESPDKLLQARQLYKEFVNSFEHLQIKTIHSFASDILLSHNNNGENQAKIISKIQLQKLIFNKVSQLLDVSNEFDFMFDFYEVKQIQEAIYSLHLNKNNILSLLKGKSKLIDPPDYQQCCAQIVALNVDELSKASKNIDSIKAILLNADGSPKKRLPKSKAKEYQLAQQILLIFLESHNEYIVNKFTNGLANLYQQIYLDVENAKKVICHMEFEDILFNFHKLLIDEPYILRKLDCSIEHIMVDEAQDLSPIQWNIIIKMFEDFFSGSGQIKADKTIFIVGDFKQSIYSFQGAMPELFASIKSLLENRLSAIGLQLKIINLQYSFRSSQTILNFIDEVFNSNSYGKVVANVDKFHHKAVFNIPGEVKVYPLEPTIKEIKSKGWHLPSSDQKLTATDNLAKKITSLIESKVDTGIYANQIMVIFRKRGQLYTKLSSLLKDVNIDVNEDSRSNFYKTIMGMDFLGLLEHLAAPYDKYRMACLLKSPFFSYNEEMLKEHILSNRIISHPTYDPVKLYYYYLYKENRLQEFIKFHGKKAYSAVKFFLQELYRALEIYGDDPILMLKYFHQDSEGINEYSNDNGVKLITAHSAKGLEADFVILADSASSENQPYDNLYFYEGEFIFLPYAEFKNKRVATIQHKLLHASYAENLRLLYVALTRARKELHLFGLENSRVKSSWYSICSNIIKL